MRFIRRETTITTMYDKEVTDEDVLSVIFSSLLNHKVEFSFVLKKHFDSEYSYRKIEYDKARIKSYNKENGVVDIIVFNGSSLTTMKNILCSDILEINATNVKNNIIDTVDDITRGDLLDI